MSDRHASVAPELPDSVRPTEDDGDPAAGARVPRCLSCGMADRPRNPLTVYDLFDGEVCVGRYRLCRACFQHANELQ